MAVLALIKTAPAVSDLLTKEIFVIDYAKHFEAKVAAFICEKFKVLPISC